MERVSVLMPCSSAFALVVSTGTLIDFFRFAFASSTVGLLSCAEFTVCWLSGEATSASGAFPAAIGVSTAGAAVLTGWALVLLFAASS